MRAPAVSVMPYELKNSQPNRAHARFITTGGSELPPQDMRRKEVKSNKGATGLLTTIETIVLAATRQGGARVSCVARHYSMRREAGEKSKSHPG